MWVEVQSEWEQNGAGKRCVGGNDLDKMVLRSRLNGRCSRRLVIYPLDEFKAAINLLQLKSRNFSRILLKLANSEASLNNRLMVIAILLLC